MALPSINLLRLTVSKIQPREDFKGQGHYSKVKSRSNKMLHTYTPQPMSLPSVNFLHLMGALWIIDKQTEILDYNQFTAPEKLVLIFTLKL